MRIGFSGGLYTAPKVAPQVRFGLSNPADPSEVRKLEKAENQGKLVRVNNKGAVEIKNTPSSQPIEKGSLPTTKNPQA